MYRFDEVSCSALAYVCHAFPGMEVLSGDALENFLYRQIRFPISSGHNARSVEGSLFSARDSASDETESLRRECGVSSLRVSVVRVSAVYDYVSFFEQRSELFKNGIDRFPCLDHDDDFPWSLERAHELLQAFGSDQILRGIICQEFSRHLCGPVVHNGLVSFSRYISRQIRSHDGESYESDFCLSICVEVR